jgi:hypothetical protein
MKKCSVLEYEPHTNLEIGIEIIMKNNEMEPKEHVKDVRVQVKKGNFSSLLLNLIFGSN